MDKLLLLSCLAMPFLLAYAQDDPVTLHFANKDPRTFQEGARNVTFVCQLNRDVMYIMTADVKMHLVREWGGSISKVHLFSNLKRVDALPEYYTMAFDNADGGINFVLTILTVRQEDDGKLVCSVGEGDDKVMDEVDITVYRDVEQVHLQFDTQPAVTSEVSEPVKVDVGDYQVMCVAEGSNPGTDQVKMYLKGEEVSTNEPVIEPMATDYRAYRSTVKATVAIDVSHTGNYVECVARGPGPNGNLKAVKIPIKVNVYDPVISCEDTEAYPGKRYVTLSCTVDHTDIAVDKYYYRLGETGVIIEEGTEKEVQGKLIMVKKSQESGTVSKLNLELYEVDDWHFDTDFVLVVESGGGHLTEGRVNFQKIEGPEDSSAMLTASLTTVLLSVIAGLL